MSALPSPNKRFALGPPSPALREREVGCAPTLVCLRSSPGGRRTMAEVKTGADHLRSLRDGRAVYIDGERVDDVTTHPAFRNAVQVAAALYDYQARPETQERMTFARSGEGGSRRINRSWQMPKSYDELVARRRAMSEWAELS